MFGDLHGSLCSPTGFMTGENKGNFDGCTACVMFALGYCRFDYDCSWIWPSVFLINEDYAGLN